MTRALGSIIIALLGLALPVDATAGWTRLTSAHFTFVGDVSKNDLQKAATRLELFRSIVTQLAIPGAEADVRPRYSPPTVVLIFRDDRSFAAYRPMFEGRPVAVAGYSSASEDTNYIAVNASRENDAYGIIFHEYTHQFLRENVGDVPLWLNEGLAELFETFELRDDGRSAIVGLASDEHLKAFDTGLPLLSLRELLTIERDSPLYNEGDRRGLFYAESWALVHSIMFGGGKTAQLQRFLALSAQGMPAANAFAQAFGDMASFDRELALYVRRASFDVRRIEADNAVSSLALRAAALSEAEVSGYLGDAMAHIGRLEDARRFLQESIAKRQTPGAMAALGLLEMRESHFDVGETWLRRAVARDPQLAAAQRWYGRALLRRAQQGGGDVAPLYLDARRALERSLVVESGHPTALFALARVELATDGAPKAYILAQQLLAQWPAREDYWLLLAESLVGQQQYADAKEYLGPLLARGHSNETRNAARDLLARIARERGAE